jgi:hypothetical protein
MPNCCILEHYPQQNQEDGINSNFSNNLYTRHPKSKLHMNFHDKLWLKINYKLRMSFYIYQLFEPLILPNNIFNQLLKSYTLFQGLVSVNFLAQGR